MRRLSLLAVAGAALTAAAIFWPRSGADAEAGAEPEPGGPAEPSPPPVAAEPPRAGAPQAPATAVPPAPPAAGAPAAPAPGSEAAALARQQMQAMRMSATRYTPHELSLYARLARMGAVPPPETKALIERRKAGATAAELEAYVRDSFPKDARVQMAAIQWIRTGAQAAPAGR